VHAQLGTHRSEEDRKKGIDEEDRNEISSEMKRKTEAEKK